MAFKSFARLSPRNKGSIIGQIHKLIKYYGDFFCIRERPYLRDLSEKDGNIYWIAEGANSLIAIALVEPEYVFTIADVVLKSVGYLISKKPGYMDRLLQHIWSDLDNSSIILFSKPSLATHISLNELNLTELNATELASFFPQFADYKTTYFNVHETLSEGLKRRGYNIYLRITEDDEKKILPHYPEFIEFLNEKKLKTKE